jgi:stage V sporulation protein R
MRLKRGLSAKLRYQALVVENAARAAGLDGFDVLFELLPAGEVNAVAAQGGFPLRYPYWRFGMEYERLEKGHRWGLSKIYELVVNNDPAYAYLVDSNSALEQKLVMAHVFGHADFFKHNVWFQPTDRRMVETMAAHAARVRAVIEEVGLERVEAFLDRVHSLETLIDPYLPLREAEEKRRGAARRPPRSERARASFEAIADAPLAPPQPSPPRARRVLLPTYDVLGFLVESAPLEGWERDLVRIVRREAYYFAPQRMTKILNEGWASYWHSRLLTSGLLEPAEVVDFADVHSAATAAGAAGLNPYRLGLALVRSAERRGMDLFMLRRVHNDVTAADELVDEEFVGLHPELFGAQPPQPADPGGAGEARGAARSWREARASLLAHIAWGGLPQIELAAEDADGQGELLLVHRHDRRDLDQRQAKDTLVCLAVLWRAPVHLLTIEEGQGRRLVCDGERVTVLDSTEAQRLCPADAAPARRA